MLILVVFELALLERSGIVHQIVEVLGVVDALHSLDAAVPIEKSRHGAILYIPVLLGGKL